MDREKVIKGLETCIPMKYETNEEKECRHEQCPYGRENYKPMNGCFWDLMSDSLELLKEQEDAFEQMRLDNTDLRNCNAELLKEHEAVEPSFKQDEKGIFVWCCGSCGAYMYHIYDGIDKAKEYAKFCRQCGKPVLWEGR